MSNLKNVQPLDDFNWEEFENGANVGTSKEELTKAYDETLNKVADHQVVDGKVISVDKKGVVSTSVTRAMVLFLHLNSATILN